MGTLRFSIYEPFSEYYFLSFCRRCFTMRDKQRLKIGHRQPMCTIKINTCILEMGIKEYLSRFLLVFVLHHESR